MERLIPSRLNQGGVMKLFLCGTVLSVLAACSSLVMAESVPKTDLTGSWIFTWENDSSNTNAVTLRHEAGTITGTYINDSQENCPVVGRLSSAAGVVLIVMCPEWDIKCEGSIESAAAVSGQYLAYGDSKGTFRISRK
jgi:hypothetical protein